MKLAIALSAAVLSIAPAAAFAQDASATGRGTDAYDKSVAPASENKDTDFPYGAAPPSENPMSQGREEAPIGRGDARE